MTQGDSKLYPRGSEWRRWDLHLHSPASALANRFGTWDEYIGRINAETEVAVIGVTDYSSIEGYKRLRAERDAGLLTSKALLIPNIEFRTTPVTEAGRAVNIHILVSPDAVDHVEQIEAALNALQLEVDGSKYTCTTSEMRRLGKKKTGSTDDELNFKEGVNQYRVPFSDLREWYRGQTWLRENSIICLSNSNKDGASGLRDSGLLLQRQDHYRFSHAIFSGNPNDRTYFLGEGIDPEAKVREDYGSLKPCVHGSDAHCVADMFKPDHDRFCWIKADPTFSGLRQILCEPKLRIHIGKEPPRVADESKYVASIELENGKFWFVSDRIDLNPGLVAVIGEKGSGKTALVDMLAIASQGYTSPSENSSFLEKARPLLGTVTAKVVWANGRSVKHKLVDAQKAGEPLVRYLSQDFVEELCSKDHSGKELIRQIEDVIFSHIDEGDQAGAADFQGLRRLKTAPYAAQRRALTEDMSRLNVEIAELEERIDQLPARQKHLDSKSAELAALQKQIKDSPASVDKTLTDALAKDRVVRLTITAQVAEKTKQLANLNNLSAKIKAKDAELQAYGRELTASLVECGIALEKIPSVDIRVPVQISELLAKKVAELAAAVAALKGSTEAANGVGSSLADIDHRIRAAEAKLKAGEVGQQRLAELQKQETKLLQEVQTATKEIARIKEKDEPLLEKKKEGRWAIQEKYFSQLALERRELEALYAPISTMLTGEGKDAQTRFDFSVQQSRDVDAWVKQGLSLIDGRRKNIVTNPEFTRVVEASLKAAWATGDMKVIRRELTKIYDDLKKNRLESLLLSHASRSALYDWLFGVDRIDLAYSLSYEGKPLEVLSPGTRGIVLLILYLEVDRYDRRPLIIDQPESNLDGASIYKDLVPYLRRAKQERQIIIVTHNPNLVVATDADQVIIATAAKSPSMRHPKISYLTGSLEHTAKPAGIREQVCELLEGGREAFETRERRYSDVAG